MLFVFDSTETCRKEGLSTTYDREDYEALHSTYRHLLLIIFHHFPHYLIFTACTYDQRVRVNLRLRSNSSAPLLFRFPGYDARLLFPLAELCAKEKHLRGVKSGFSDIVGHRDAGTCVVGSLHSNRGSTSVFRMCCKFVV